MKTKILVLLASILILGFGYYAISQALNVKKEQKIESINIERKELDLNKVELDLKQLNLELKQQLKKDDLDKKTIESLQDKIESQKEREKQLEADLVAKRAKQQADKDRAAKVAQNALNTVTQTQTAYASTGNCAEWKAQAGIPNTHATNTLINGESGCDPTVWNSAGSGAYGIPQALPRTKLLDPAQCGGADGYTNPVTQLKWMQCYVERRYGSWDNALAMWYSRSPNKWY